MPGASGATSCRDAAGGEHQQDLKKRGFTFVGPTIMYAYLQATGVVNDHLVTCFRYDA